MTCDPHPAQDRIERRADGGRAVLPEDVERELLDARRRDAAAEVDERAERRG